MFWNYGNYNFRVNRNASNGDVGIQNIGGCRKNGVSRDNVGNYRTSGNSNGYLLIVAISDVVVVIEKLLVIIREV